MKNWRIQWGLEKDRYPRAATIVGKWEVQTAPYCLSLYWPFVEKTFLGLT